ncbi:hypothetical protein LJC74_01280 [Eubacteriales bacterium OttesenSCG-928-A19]|nr:hypothetical protein [Eubacteriales bacterium OttesenSCG-928-A19]
MRIEWVYLDKRAATVAALKDLSAMEFILLNYKDDAEEAQARKTSVKTGPVRITSNSRNPQGAETRLAATLDTIDLLSERYFGALEYMAWFKPAYDMLSADEQYLLTTFYAGGDTSSTDCVELICDHFHIERSTAYNKKNRALSHLVSLLYGSE